MHLYYVHVISRLLAGDPSFAQYFSIRTPIPPYAVHYLLLLGLGKFVSPLLAEKVVVCLVLMVFATGFRFLCKTLQPSVPAVGLFGIPLSLNWMVGMGFHNFCLSLGLSFWAVACWVRASRSQRPVWWAVYLALVLMVLFSHPVPLLFVLAFCVSDLAVVVLQDRGKSLGSRLRARRAEVVFTALSLCAVSYIGLFLNVKQTSSNMKHALIQRGMLFDFARLRPLMLTTGTGGAWLYWLGLVATLVLAFTQGGRGFLRRWKLRNFQSADVLFAGAVVLLLFYPLLPRTINNADYFADRLVIYIWVCALVAAGFSAEQGTTASKALAALSIPLAMISLYNAEVATRHPAQVLQHIETTGLPAPGTRGIYINAPIAPASSPVTFDPYIWASARYFRRANAVLLNAPWLALATVPVSASPDSLARRFPSNIMNSPDQFAGLLIGSGVARRLVSRDLEFLVMIGRSSLDPGVVDNVLLQDWGFRWDCSRLDWYAVCSAKHTFNSELGRGLLSR